MVRCLDTSVTKIAGLLSGHTSSKINPCVHFQLVNIFSEVSNFHYLNAFSMLGFRIKNKLSSLRARNSSLSPNLWSLKLLEVNLRVTSTKLNDSNIQKVHSFVEPQINYLNQDLWDLPLESIHKKLNILYVEVICCQKQWL